MATLPRFVFPPRPGADPTTTEKRDRERPHISLRTRSREREGKGHTLSVPDLGYKRPESIATPPDSPTRHRSFTMGADSASELPHKRTMTPPPTPTRSAHSKSTSSSSIRTSLDNLRRGDSISSQTRPYVAPFMEQPGGMGPLQFPYWLSDYEVTVDENGKQKLLGTGAWSNVYAATPCLPKPKNPALPSASVVLEMSPPITPVRSRTSSQSKAALEAPTAYAIKVPNGKSARRVLGEECRMLSYLSRQPEAGNYVVPFFGQDTRNDALIMQLMDCTLESWIQRPLNDAFSETDRQTVLALVFPLLASQLLTGLAWLHDKSCVHADIKPANILLSNTSSTFSPHAVYTDFSSAILSAPSALDSDSSHTATPLGGATWDFLDPSLLTKAAATTAPPPHADVWAIAMTLLVVVIGTSPYSRVATNAFQKREMIRQGTPLECMRLGDDGPRNAARLNGLSVALGFDVEAWFARVLVRDVEKRAELGEWRESLSGLLEKGVQIAVV